jgi:hypothetical protein
MKGLSSLLQFFVLVILANGYFPFLLRIILAFLSSMISILSACDIEFSFLYISSFDKYIRSFFHVFLGF